MEPERITSAKNPLISHIRKLQNDRTYRVAQQQFVADGRKLLDEALRWGPELCAVVCAEDFACPELPPQVRRAVVPESLMQSLSSMRTPQGVVFTARLPRPQPLHLVGGTLLLDRIQDPGNLGTILRTADAFSVPVVLAEGCADPYSEKTVRASMGAVFRTPPQSAKNRALLALCRARGLRITATALSDTAQDIRSLCLRDDVVVIGSEGQGVCAEFLNAAERHMIIPMNPRCESLNAATAAAIVLWQMHTVG